MQLWLSLNSCSSLVVGLFYLEQVRCTSISTNIVNNLACWISFLSFYHNQWHFGMVNSFTKIDYF